MPLQTSLAVKHLTNAAADQLAFWQHLNAAGKRTHTAAHSHPHAGTPNSMEFGIRSYAATACLSNLTKHIRS